MALRMLLALPAEIIHEVAQYLDQPTLLALARTCRGLSIQFLVPLYANPTISNSNQLLNLQRRVQKDPVLRRAIRGLHLIRYASWEHYYCNETCPVLPFEPPLETCHTLTIEAPFHAVQLVHLLSLSASYPALREINLSSVDVPEHPDLSTASTNPHVRTISLGGQCGELYTPPWMVLRHLFPCAQELTLTGCPGRDVGECCSLRAGQLQMWTSVTTLNLARASTVCEAGVFRGIEHLSLDSVVISDLPLSAPRLKTLNINLYLHREFAKPLEGSDVQLYIYDTLELFLGTERDYPVLESITITYDTRVKSVTGWLEANVGLAGKIRWGVQTVLLKYRTMKSGKSETGDLFRERVSSRGAVTVPKSAEYSVKGF